MVVALIDQEARRRLLVSPRTRYNEFPLSFCSLTAGIERDGAVPERIPLTEATHPTLGHHYGAVVDPFSEADLSIAVESPPQVARHEGYETAFFEPPALSLRASL